MSRILTGVQSTGTPHLGNLLGAIIPAIEMANDSKNESYLFIANMHTLTQIKDAKTLKHNTYSVAATWLAFGLDIHNTVFYRQSDVPQTTELTWYLSCFFPYQRLTLAHSFKDKADRLDDVNAGLFSYPMLMAADILLYDADLVPVGKDQMQHIEMMLYAVKNPFVFVGKKELTKIPLFGFFYKRTCILVDRKSMHSRKEVFNQAQRRLNQGVSICIFPEGGVPDDETVVLDSFKDGAFRLAIEHQIPIVPLVFYDNKKRFSYTFFSGSPGRMRAKILPFFSPKGYTQENKAKLKQEVREAILTELKA